MAFVHFEKFLNLSTWAAERAAAFRMMYKMTQNQDILYMALKEDPSRRETLVDLANYYYIQRNWAACKLYAEAALSIKEKPLDYLCDNEAWGFAPYDYAAIASFYLGLKEDAVNYGYKALELDPDNTRLSDNLNWYTKTTNNN